MRDYVFSWAENASGQMVHIDSVLNGKACDCHCPHCKEPLVAKHGELKAHHFAHHSETRKSTLEMCYQVILYKVAEHLVQTHKKIHAPSYYGIFPETNLEFEDVRVDSQYEREDKQPDVIARGKDGKEYLIEFIFDFKVQHKQPLDYINLTCLEIDLSRQSLDTVENFLLSSAADRKWVNNQNYFSSIEERYIKTGRNIRITNESECAVCPLKYDCIGVTPKYGHKPLVIENSGQKFRLCKPEVYKDVLEEAERQAAMDEERRKEQEAYIAEQRRIREQQRGVTTAPEGVRSCFNCRSNLAWMNRGGTANCGQAPSLRLPKKHSPQVALNCPRFSPK